MFSIGVEKQTQMMVVLQNILSSVMLKNDKLDNGNVRLYMAIPETHRSTVVYCLFGFLPKKFNIFGFEQVSLDLRRHESSLPLNFY